MCIEWPDPVIFARPSRRDPLSILEHRTMLGREVMQVTAVLCVNLNSIDCPDSANTELKPLLDPKPLSRACKAQLLEHSLGILRSASPCWAGRGRN